MAATKKKKLFAKCFGKNVSKADTSKTDLEGEQHEKIDYIMLIG
jgi:hypothetical protein